MKLLATDLDGTLLRDNKLSDQNRQAVEALKRGNHKFVVSTGRPLNGVLEVKKILEDKIDYYVLLNGAYILDKELNLLEDREINKEVVKDIIEKHTFEDTSISFERGDLTYVFRGNCENLAYDFKKKVQSIDDVDGKIRLISLYYKGRDLEEIDAICKEINNNYDHIVAYRNMVYIDVVPAGCSKGIGVEMVRGIEGIKDENLYTIGDSWNDVTMFEITENSFTFHEVEEGLKLKAKNIVDSVGQCIEEYILN